MLYTFFGSDIDKIRNRSRALVDVLRNKRQDAGFFRLNLQNWNNSHFTELILSIGLFSPKYIVILDNILTGETINKVVTNELRRVPDSNETVVESDFDISTSNLLLVSKSGSKPSDSPVSSLDLVTDESSVSVVMRNLEKLKKSEHIWIIVEDALFGKSAGKELGIKENKALIDIRISLKKNSDKMEEYDNQTSTTFDSSGIKYKNITYANINSFVFTDAFFNKHTDKAINAFTLLQQQNIAPEEIHGALWWQFKTLMLVHTKNIKSLSPFVVQKSLRFLKKWNIDDLYDLSDAIIKAYHEAHLGKVKLEDALLSMVVKLSIDSPVCEPLVDNKRMN